MVQVAGKKRAEIVVPKDTQEGEITTQALKEEAVERKLAGKAPSRVIYVEGRLINIVP